ncbi:hypothetical protein PTTG_09355 [Puccinia triticina 1-1 BBBD Race 1]|uniref:CP-type G domain-containing protein n=2 Tax=Puccinia triticina TaxID=208348 RepID=A0A180GA38_PUCT1|nr:uncharacterized protein PtA15_4A8 [Puccinia triticina]OAV89192.1 hypothetical protein PTTG_09355 [Puccinia triticina 1-1 BBBD Race 1]WAQ83560.1 hypothetical protein PtA15_4A8 [Puccinia triticina]WAR54392.1 hypothetical protein PtB15_4B9 [Puccinia triticina]
MPKIRKKTSKRSTTRMKEKIKHKVKEAHKKAKKNSKKDVTWKSRVKKDIGIPALFPFKDQLLAEQQQAKLQHAEEKQAQRQNASTSAAASAAALAELMDNDPSMDLDQPLDEQDQDLPDDPALTTSSIRAHAKSLQKVLALSDVLIEVLDARDPLGTRSLQLERDAVQQGKKVLLVLNKVDLVPKQNVDSWLAYLRRSWPTLPFKSSTQSQRNNLSSRGSQASGRENSSSANACSIQPLMQLLKNYARRSTVVDPSQPSSTVKGVKSLASITVGIIGFPNVGKSSLINTLKRSRVCGVAPTPGFTKEVQEIVLEKGLKVLDCPGVVLSIDTTNSETAAAHVLRNAVKIEQILDPLAPVGVILNRCKTEHLMLLYNIPAFTYPGQSEDEKLKEFLIQVSRSRGRVKKGGIPDLQGCAKAILQDWNTGRIPYYTVPPPLPKGEEKSKTSTNTNDLGTSTILNELGAEFNLDALFADADRDVLGQAEPTDNVIRPAVRMTCSNPENAGSGELKLLGESADDIEMHDERPVKRSQEISAPEVVSLAPKKKSKQVNFATTTSAAASSSGTTKASQLERMGISAPIGENKLIAKQARKERKKLAKSKTNVIEEDEITMEDANNVNQTTEPVVEDQAYSFADFFHGTKAVARTF